MAVFTVIERGKYSGGDLLFPQYDLGVSVRSRDLLIMENNKLWHCNNKIIKKNRDVIRLSFVCYLRDKIVESNKLKELLKDQINLTTKEKIEDMMGKDAKKKILGKGNFGHEWYQLENSEKILKYYNKQYTIIDKKTNDITYGLILGYKKFLDDKKNRVN
tara:strand:- start:50 stop:529 length:480 start_codon:yes stop_codon:yes gene_type:complete